MTFVNLKEKPYFDLIPGIRGKVVHGEKITVAHWDIAAGTVLPLHSHVHEQIANVISGSFELTIAGETQVLEAGMVGIIPSGVEHSGKALTDCHLIDVFQPARPEYE